MFVEFMHTSIVSWVIHKYKYYTNTLPLCDYTEKEFHANWTVISSMTNSAFEDSMLILKDSARKISYLPVFNSEIKLTGYNNCYDIIQHRIVNQISDLSLSIDDKYKKLFGDEYQYFVPYYIDNNYIEQLDKMIEEFKL